jgi:proteasome assembly chaperone (PAC2) family protein
MTNIIELTEQPQAETMYMIAGWRQWADGGSVSSGLPPYLVRQTSARKIGEMRNDGFYLFQIPGTHDLVRPTVRFVQGYPQSLDTQRNELFYAGDRQQGVLYFIGDEPHLDIERYVGALLDTAESLGVQRIITLGGVYGELPFDKERAIHAIYSQRRLKEELEGLAVDFSNYHGGASIGSHLCRRAGDRNMELVGMYAFVPTYDFSALTQRGTSIRIENDYMAWLGVVRRLNYMLRTHYSLTDLEQKSRELVRAVQAKVDELDSSAPQIGVREYMRHLSEAFEETVFEPLDNVWEDELRRLLDDSDDEETE